MNTILTDDERRQLIQSIVLTSPGTHEQISRAIEAAVLAKLARQEPVAMRYDFDGYGYRYIDSGSGSDWRTRIPDAEAVYAAPQQADRQRIYDAATHASAMAVFMTRMDAEQPDADDKGVSGWLQEAEKRIKRRMLAAKPEAPAQAEQAAEPVRDELVTALAECRDAFPVPPHGSPLEREWCSAMAKPLCVPDYVRAAVASTERQPLTDEQIVNMANPTQHLPDAPEGWVRFGFSRRHLVGFARSIERAHGIGDSALAQKGGDA